MAGIVLSECRQCAHQTIWQAKNKQSHVRPEVGLFPAYCDQCDEITPANYATETPTCIECHISNIRHMDDPSISAGDGQTMICSWFGAKTDETRSVMISWTTFTGRRLSIRQKLSRSLLGYYMVEQPIRLQHQITDGHYLCPNCKTFGIKVVKNPAANRC